MVKVLHKLIEELNNILWRRKVSVGAWEASCAVCRSDEDIAR